MTRHESSSEDVINSVPDDVRGRHHLPDAAVKFLSQSKLQRFLYEHLRRLMFCCLGSLLTDLFSGFQIVLHLLYLLFYLR